MTRLEHANLCLADIEPSLQFLLHAFPNWSVRGRGTSPWHKGNREWVHVGTENNYITLNNNAQIPLQDTTQGATGLAHLGFEVDNVDTLTKRLLSHGYDIDIIAAKHPFRKSIYFRDPAGFQFEFIEYLSTVDSERNVYGLELGEAQLVNSTKPPKKTNKSYNHQKNSADDIQFIQTLYRCVDQKDTLELSKFLSEDIYFRFANASPVNGITEVIEANEQFFSSINSMRHEITDIRRSGDTLSCHGSVHYKTLANNSHCANFATILTLVNNKISSYLIFADVSALFDLD